MSCGKHFDSDNCVCDVLREIADAQTDVLPIECDSSCEQSIADLLGEREDTNGLDTVPVLLYCDCKPFKGFGAPYEEIGNLFGSFFFRVKEVDEDCCATLELLRTPGDTCKDPESPVDQDTSNLRTTGICITVDVKCFCHITCLPAIDAITRV
ncbi:CotY/CotZ family spore coat protein [Bacillaceae bacterium S4-13-58]